MRSLKLLLCWISFLTLSISISASSDDQFTLDGTVLELTDSNFDSAISTFDCIFVDFYAPWCGHCKRLNPELDAAAPILAKLKQPIVIAKLNADKYSRLARKIEIDAFPTLMLYNHGVPMEYYGPRKADLLVRYLKKFVAPDVAVLESDSTVKEFVEDAGTFFPVFIGFGLNESIISGLGRKYKKKAWFAVSKEVSEDTMVSYDFDKAPALVANHPTYNEHSVFYGPFEDGFLEEFVKQSFLPLILPINHDTLKLLKDDERKIVLTIVEDETHESLEKQKTKMGLDWGPVLMSVIFFIVLSPGVLFQLPGKSKAVEFGGFQTSGPSIVIHTLLFFAFITISLIALHIHIYAA